MRRAKKKTRENANLSMVRNFYDPENFIERSFNKQAELFSESLQMCLLCIFCFQRIFNIQTSLNVRKQNKEGREEKFTIISGQKVTSW